MKIKKLLQKIKYFILQNNLFRMKIRGNNYKERGAFQLQQWVKGNSIHNTVDGECCPDFSCCCNHFKTPQEIRKTFLAGNDEQKEPFLFSFLTDGISKLTDKKVYVADGKT